MEAKKDNEKEKTSVVGKGDWLVVQTVARRVVLFVLWVETTVLLLVDTRVQRRDE